MIMVRTFTCLLLLLVAAAPAQVRVRLATLAPKGSTFHQILLAMGEKWRQAPGGGAQLTVYPDGVMGGEADVVRRMRVGQLHAGMLTAVGLSEIDPSVTALQNIPMMFRTLEEVDYAAEKLRPMLQKRFLDKGFVPLFWGDAGWVHYFSKVSFTRPAELQKLKLFAWAGETRQVDLMKGAGYRPVPLETADILPGLQTGLIEAVAMPPFFALASQVDTQARHMLALKWAPLFGATVITKKAWDTVPAAAQPVLLQAAREAGDQMKVRNRTESEQAVAAMKKRGLQVLPVSLQIEVEWRQAAEEFYPKIRGNLVPADFFDEVQQVLQQYRSAKK
jgi:TRAP-type C4-dicarboxylate transport system substrate-binding protein